MAYPVKHKERHDFYYSVANPAIGYKDFIQRCVNNKHKINRELMEKIIMRTIVRNDTMIDSE
jgi:hypothetical protein